MTDIDAGTIFAAGSLVAGFLSGMLCVLIALFLALQMLWQRFHGKTALRQEQQRAIATAQAIAIQQQYDAQRRLKLYMTILTSQAVILQHIRFRGDNDTGKGACL